MHPLKLRRRSRSTLTSDPFVTSLAVFLASSGVSRVVRAEYFCFSAASTTELSSSCSEDREICEVSRNLMHGQGFRVTLCVTSPQAFCFVTPGSGVQLCTLLREHCLGRATRAGARDPASCVSSTAAAEIRQAQQQEERARIERDERARTERDENRRRFRTDVERRVDIVGEDLAAADGVTHVLDLAHTIDSSDLNADEKGQLLAQLTSPLLRRALRQAREMIGQSQLDRAEALLDQLTWFVSRVSLTTEQQSLQEELRSLQRDRARRSERLTLITDASGLIQAHQWRDARVQLLRAEEISADSQTRALVSQIEQQRVSPAAAFGMSFALPGVGQFYSRRYVAGAIFTGGTIVSLTSSITYLVLADTSYREYLGANSVDATTTAYARVQNQANFAVGFGIAAAVLWLINVIDTPLGAVRYNRDELGL